MVDERYYDSPSELYKYGGFFWQPEFITTTRHGRKFHNMHGPFCGTCRASVKFVDDEHSTNATCQNCEKNYQAKVPISLLSQRAQVAFQAKLRENFKVESLELPSDVIMHKDENDNYWVEARLGQKNGKLMAVIYMGEKLPNQSKQDYIQMFADIEDQQIRFDKGNKNPLTLLSKIEAEFEDSAISVAKKM